MANCCGTKIFPFSTWIALLIGDARQLTGTEGELDDLRTRCPDLKVRAQNDPSKSAVSSNLVKNCRQTVCARVVVEPFSVEKILEIAISV